MSKGGILAVLGAGLVLGSAGLVGQLGGDDGEVVADAGSTEPAHDTANVAEDLRPVVLEGACPEVVREKGKGPAQSAARCRDVVQLDGRCVCLTAQSAGDVDGEVGSASALPASARVRLLVCGDRPGRTSVRHIREGERLDDKTCSVVTSPENPDGYIAADVSLGMAETDMVRLLAGACAPCSVTGESSGPCPHCLRWAGGCAAACAEK